MALAFVIEVVEGMGGGEEVHAFHVYLNSRLKFYLELGDFFPFDSALWSTFHASRIIHIMGYGWVSVSS